MSLTPEQQAEVIAKANGLMVAAIGYAIARNTATAQAVAQTNPGAQVVNRDKRLAAEGSMPAPTQKQELAFGNTQQQAQEAVLAYFNTLAATPTPGG